MIYITADWPHKLCLWQVLLILLTLFFDQPTNWEKDNPETLRNRRKPDNKPGLERVINYPQIITFNDILWANYHKNRSFEWLKNQIQTNSKIMLTTVCVCGIYTGNATSGSTCTANFMETMEGIPIANRFLSGWPLNGVIAWFKVLLSLER